MELNQEALLLRDAMVNAALSDISENTASVLACSKLIKDTVKDVRDIMTVDDKTSKEMNEAEQNMHSIIFHKALQSSGKLEGPLKEHFQHACESFPSVSWRVYVQAVVSCSWHNLADECWRSLPESTFLDAAEGITKYLKLMLEEKNAVLVWQCLLRRLICTVLSVHRRRDCRSADIICELVECGSTYPDSCPIANSTRARVIFEQLNFLCVSFCKDPTMIFECEELRRILCAFFREADASRVHLDFSSPTCPYWVCHFSVKKLCEIITRESSLHQIITSTIAEWPKRVRDFKATTIDDVVENESADLMNSIAATDNIEFSEDGLDQLVESLQTDFDDKVLSFLSSRCNQLTQQQVATLMVIRLDNFTDLETGATILKICMRAFSSWNLDVQDAFRNKYHKNHGLCLEKNVSITSGHQEQLSDIVNRISTDEDVETSTIGDLSRLCLNFPMETIKILVEHAIKHGQILSVAKILFHLKGTCAASVPSEDCSLLTNTLKAFVSNDDLQMSSWTNCKALINELVFKSLVLDAKELLENLVATSLLPLSYCWRVLQVLQAILPINVDANVEDLQKICWTSENFSSILFLVTQVLDECESSSTTWDLLLTKGEAHVTLCKLRDLLKRQPHLLPDTDRTWLLKSTMRFHETVRFRLQFMVGELATTKDFEGKSVEDLLQMSSVSKEVFDLVAQHLRLKRREIFAENNRILVAFVKILGKLSAVELRAAMDLVILLYQDTEICDDDGHHAAVVTVIRDVAEALIALATLSAVRATHQLTLVQNFTTRVKALIDLHTLMENKILLKIVCVMSRLFRCLVDDPESQYVIKLLVVDILKKIFAAEDNTSLELNTTKHQRRRVVMAVVRIMNDHALMDTVKRLASN